MKPKSNQSRQAAFKSRMRDSGFVQVAVWIPKDKKPELAEFVKRMNVQ